MDPATRELEYNVEQGLGQAQSYAHSREEEELENRSRNYTSDGGYSATFLDACGIALLIASLWAIYYVYLNIVDQYTYLINAHGISPNNAKATIGVMCGLSLFALCWRLIKTKKTQRKRIGEFSDSWLMAFPMAIFSAVIFSYILLAFFPEQRYLSFYSYVYFSYYLTVINFVSIILFSLIFAIFFVLAIAEEFI